MQKEPNAYLTTFIDLYGLHLPEQFPKWHEAFKLKNKPYERVDMLEHAMEEALPDVYRQRFIANIVLHEFEGLLFNDLKYFDDYFETKEFKNRNELESILMSYPNPELINDTKATSPSHRLDGGIFHSFKKTVDGIEIAIKIGLNAIRNKSKHFNDWIYKLESI